MHRSVIWFCLCDGLDDWLHVVWFIYPFSTMSPQKKLAAMEDMVYL